MDEVAFGRYRLIELIGHGGMGTVYKAHDTVMRRDVAIKVLSPELVTEPGYADRFRREAYTAAKLTEPHIIPIYGADEIDGRLYMVMPVIDGIAQGTLRPVRHGAGCGDQRVRAAARNIGPHKTKRPVIASWRICGAGLQLALNNTIGKETRAAWQK